VEVVAGRSPEHGLIRGDGLNALRDDLRRARRKKVAVVLKTVLVVTSDLPCAPPAKPLT
jgi:hypothetical protein